MIRGALLVSDEVVGLLLSLPVVAELLPVTCWAMTSPKVGPVVGVVLVVVLAVVDVVVVVGPEI